MLSLQDAPPQCKPVYSIQTLTHLQEKLFPGDHMSFETPHKVMVFHLFGANKAVDYISLSQLMAEQWCQNKEYDTKIVFS